jgi:glycosyltransferase involved in cell wall biosynthesis
MPMPANTKSPATPTPKPPTEVCLLSLVVPVKDESGSIEPFLKRVRGVLDEIVKPMGERTSYEILFVDDGSKDSTLDELRAAREADPRVRIVSLSRNFGKDTALAAGLEHAVGHAVIPIDVDLQDPPEVIPGMVEHWMAGYDVVTARRSDRSSDSWFKRFSARSFYRVFNWLADRPITPDAGDFRLLSRTVVDVLRQFPERARFMKGLFAWVGFKEAHIEYTRAERETGTSKWRYWKLWNFALDGITSSSTAPLRVWTYIGAIAAFVAFVYAAVLIIRTFLFGVDVPGYASIMVAVLFLGALQLLSLGIIGEYLGRTYLETKGRPLYIVRETFGMEDETRPSTAPLDIPHRAPAEIEIGHS